MPQKPALTERGLSLPVWDGTKNVSATDGASSDQTPGGDLWSEHGPVARYGATNGADGCASTVKTLPSDEVGEGEGGTATLLSCTINLANTIVGAGMLGLPGAFGGTGYAGGTILIVVGAAFSAHGLALLARAATMVGAYPSSFYTVARAALPQYTILIDLAVALKCFGVATGYLITVADCMIDALDHLLLPQGGPPTNWATSILLSRRFWVAGAAFGVLPVSFYHEFDRLKHASAAALGFVFLLAGGIVAYARGWAGDPCEGYDPENDDGGGAGGAPCMGEVVPFTDGPSTLSKIPIFIFAFTCQQNIFPIVNEIQRRSVPRITVVIVAAIGFALTIFYVVATEGYSTYGDRVKGDILLNYPEDGKVTFMRVCIAFMLILHYPLQLDPSRRCVMSLLKVVGGWMRERRIVGTRGGDDSSLASNADSRSSVKIGPEGHLQGGYTRFSKVKHPSPQREHAGAIEVECDTPCMSKKEDSAASDSKDVLFLTVTISFLLLSFTLAMAVDDLGVILALVGATGSTLVSYILPGIIYVKVQRSFCLAKVTAYIQLAMGCLIMPTALYFVLCGGVKE